MLKEYWIIRSGTLNFPIARKENSIIERCVSDIGQNAITHYEVLKEFSDYSLIECKLETGRTHQIRVHFAYIGHPLVGDSLYNINSNVNSLIHHQALHSYKMEFIHPVTQNTILLEANLFEDMKNLII